VLLTDPAGLALSGAALLLAVAAGWSMRPKVPSLDGERWFKVILATVIRGEVEGAGGSPADWERRVRELVWYHPAGRLPERKIADPHSFALGSGPEGEAALVEALKALTEPQARWARLYDGDELADAVRLDDPVELGPDYDPGRWAPGFGWDQVGALGRGGSVGPLVDKLGARWLFVGDAALGKALGEVLGQRLDVAPPDLDRLGLAVHCAGILKGEGDRLVIVGEGEGAITVLEALADEDGLRDVVLAVVAVSAPLLGRPGEVGRLSQAARQDFMAARFTHKGLDTETVRWTPYFAVQKADRSVWPPGLPRLPIENARFPEVKLSDKAPETLEAVDLGVVPAHIDEATLARALVVAVSLWTLSRRDG
jgi:hypothetical protein